MTTVRRTFLAALSGLAVAACGGNETTSSCPSGDVCTHVVDGGPSSTMGGGVTVIATQIQATATSLASDGTSLYWSSSAGPGGPISRVPVAGGAVTTLVQGPISGGFLAVDDANVYYVDQSGGLSRSPKNGGDSATQIAPMVRGVTVLGGTAYWAAYPQGGGPGQFSFEVDSAPLKGGPASVVANVRRNGPAPDLQLGVTSSTAFLTVFPNLVSFPLASGVPDGGMPAAVPGMLNCINFLVSDTNAVYCGSPSSVLAVASDGTVTPLGTLFQQGVTAGAGGLAFDDTNVYWVDATTVGTIERAPKSGGGMATVIARDTSPVAIAVDQSYVYWSDVGGNINRISK